MKPFSRQGLNSQGINTSSPEPVAPALHDSKSAVYLNSYSEENKKFRETTYHPTSTKNTNLQFLRYTVNVKKNQREHSSNQLITPSQFKIHRKMTEDVPKTSTQPKEATNVGWKPMNLRQSEKKNSNPEKKQDPTFKPFIPSSRVNEKKNLTEEKSPTSHKTDRIKEQNSTLHKRIFTPKYSKNIGDAKSVSKFGASFSTSDLLKEDLANSTSQSISCRLINPRRRSIMIQIEDFLKIKFLGEGKFGQVYMCMHKKTNTFYALKQIKKKEIIQNDMIKQFIMELKLQFYLTHPNILKLYGVFDDEENIYLILEYMEEGTLYNQLKRKKTFKQADTSKKLRDILEGVSYLHSLQIAHRDIKPQNIVISYDVCKICDLGWAAVCEDRRKTLCGTIDYASPQLLEGKQYGTAIDLWCMGVLCYELMVGKAPFYHICRKETMKRIVNADISDINLPNSVPYETKDFIVRLLKKNPEERMKADEALNHGLITKYNEEEMQEIRSPKRKKL